ncbi:hypothetical protein RhiirA4_425360 [Rhizophagus irregularis]|uniref:Endonuclease/exonuclease/phosphatase domain-containing protein n=1 Tax=Rhizophagus irregularis TaxID=588596 RepID=A0A2I1H105_9GLOM|nr:hypothetical protein RhiirA4_425360 [Rhizophagus irregularis]
MSMSKVPSVINPDIPPPPTPKVSAPSGDRSLSPDNSAGAPNKRTRTVSNNDMEVEPTASTNTTTSGPISGLVSTVPSGLPVNKVTVISQPQTINASLDASIHAHPLPASTVPPTKDKGKSVAFDVPVRQPFPDGNAAAIKSSPSRFHAAAYLHDAPSAFKEKFTTNRTMCDEVDRALSRYSSYGSKARCEGSGDNKRILVFFFVQDDHSACVQTPCADLLDLVFTPIRPQKRVAVMKKSLCLLLTFLFSSMRHSRREHVAILAGIPKNIKEADLLEIASQVNAKAINIPLSYNSYKPKPYAYFNFTSFENLEAAKELTIAFRGKGLSWHSPDEAKSLCHPRPVRRTNDRLNKLYTRFNAGPQRGRPNARQSRSPSGSRSRSRSNSRSRKGESSATRSTKDIHSNPGPYGADAPNRPPRNRTPAPQNTTRNTNNHQSIPNSTSHSSTQAPPSLPPDIIKEIKDQLTAMAATLRALDERVENLEYSITDHCYRISELESAMNFSDSSGQNDEFNHQPETYPYQDEDCGWDSPNPKHNYNNGQADLPSSGCTLNVRSLVHASKQMKLFSLLLSHQLHGLILTETNLQAPAHKYVCDPYLSQYNYHKWFSFSASVNHHAGVGILLHSSLAMYVIKKRFHKDRLISLFLQLPGRQNLLIIGAYIPPSSGLSNKLIAECHSVLISWITSARCSGTHILLGGDLNANFDSFINNISNDSISLPVHPLFRYLHTPQFDDLGALDPSTSLPIPTFKSASSGQLSRLDYLWTSPGFFITHLWSHVEDTLDTFNSDHLLLVGFFDFFSIRDLRAPSYLKQRLRYRTAFNVHAALPDQKVLFTFEIDVGLQTPDLSTTTNNLNRNWHRLKMALLNAARSAFPKQIISSNHTKTISPDLQPFLHISHKLDHYIGSLSRLFNISELNTSWNRFYPSFSQEFLELFADSFDFINQLPFPNRLYSDFIAAGLSFMSYLAHFRSLLQPMNRLISARLKLEFNNQKHNAMKSAIAERNVNFYEDKGKFIRSSLNREKRSIVLDRILVTDLPGNPQLLIAPDDIHKAAIEHFQNVVGPSKSPYKILSDLPERWKNRYSPLTSINPEIYYSVMAPITDSELRAVINNSPSKKAPGPSSIPYE